MNKKYIFLLLLTIFIFLFFVWCCHADRTRNKIISSTFSIVCTTSILTDTVRNIAGPRATVKGLMGPGVDPHTYRARESDVHALANADIIFYHGLHLEGKMTEILHGMHTYATTVAIADCLTTRDLISSDEFENLYDPHIWFCVPLWIRVTRHICNALVAKDPDHAQEYTHNTNVYIQHLEQLHTQLMVLGNTIPAERRILVTAHDSFGYFGKTYQFQVVGLQGINTDAQAGTRDIQELADFIIHHKIPTIFVESSIPQRTIQAVQQATHARGFPVAIGPELYSDALGAPTSAAATYSSMLLYNMHVIVDALS